MESNSNCENLLQIKDELKVWLKNYHQYVTTKNQTLTSCLLAKQQRNKDFKIKIEKLTNNSLNTSMIVTDVTNKKLQSQIEANINNLKTKSEQLSKCNETFHAKVEEETKKSRKKFYETITKDVVALKPYHEVETVIKDLIHKTDCCIKKLNEDKENFIINLKQLKGYYIELKQNIIMLQPIEREIKNKITTCNKSLEQKLKSLNLKCFEEACNDSNEAKELLQDINNVKSHLSLP